MYILLQKSFIVHFAFIGTDFLSHDRGNVLSKHESNFEIANAYWIINLCLHIKKKNLHKLKTKLCIFLC